MKIRLYEGIFLLNQGFEQVIREMDRMKKAFNRETLQGYLDNIQELRALTNVEFTDHMQERENRDAFVFEKKRRAWERKLRDPDDVYIEVMDREEERRKKGLPARLGILAHSEVAAEELEAEEEARKKRAQKRRK